MPTVTAQHTSDWEYLQGCCVDHEMFLIKPFTEALRFGDEPWVLFPMPYFH